MTFPHGLTASELNSHSQNSAAHHLGISIVEIGDYCIVASMPVDERTRGGDGRLKMGAIAVLTESVGSLAAGLCVDRERFMCLGQSLQVTYLADVSAGGHVVARATNVLLETDRHIWNINVTDHEGTKVAQAKLSVIVLSI